MKSITIRTRTSLLIWNEPNEDREKQLAGKPNDRAQRLQKPRPNTQLKVGRVLPWNWNAKTISPASSTFTGQSQLRELQVREEVPYRRVPIVVSNQGTIKFKTLTSILNQYHSTWLPVCVVFSFLCFFNFERKNSELFPCFVYSYLIFSDTMFGSEVNSFCFVDADMEDYGFEYSDEEQEEQDVDIENQYYNSKGISNGFSLYCKLRKVCFLSCSLMYDS